MFKTLGLKTAICIIFIGFFGQHLIYENWEGILVCFAAILLVPIGIELLFKKKIYIDLISIFGFLLLPAYAFHSNILSKLLRLPYWLYIVSLTTTYALDFLRKKKFLKTEN